MPELQTFPFSALGSDCIVYLGAAPDVASHAAALAIAEVARIEAAYSRYRADSVLSTINRIAAEGGTLDVDAETAGLIDYAFACWRKSAGLFDISSGVLRQAWDFSSGHLPSRAALDRLLPRVGLDKVVWESPRLSFPVAGMELDFGGIGKEYAADRVADLCRLAGIASGLVDLGGDIHVIGPDPDGAPWTIRVRHPRQPAVAMATVQLAQGAIASSGDYERYFEAGGRRYCHILNPKTGWPAAGLAAVSVIGERCLAAGSIATMAMLKGAAGIAWLRDLRIEHVWMDDAGNQGGVLGQAATATCR